MTDSHAVTNEPVALPRNHAEYCVWYDTELPKIKAELARLREDLRWIAEGRYKVPGARLPSERRG